MSLVPALLPRQWLKNLLVAFALIAAGNISPELVLVVLRIFGFVFISSLGYLYNDWIDRVLDQFHFKKLM